MLVGSSKIRMMRCETKHNIESPQAPLGGHFCGNPNYCEGVREPHPPLAKCLSDTSTTPSTISCSPSSRPLRSRDLLQEAEHFNLFEEDDAVVSTYDDGDDRGPIPDVGAIGSVRSRWRSRRANAVLAHGFPQCPVQWCATGWLVRREGVRPLLP